MAGVWHQGIVAASVPEPGSLVLAGIAAGGLVFHRLWVKNNRRRASIRPAGLQATRRLFPR